MALFARTIHFDESDSNVYARPAESGEWAIPGGFEFSNWTDSQLVGKARQAFANGWLGLGGFGRATFVAVTQIEEAERAAVTAHLADHLMAMYGAPSREAAMSAAEQEIAFTIDLCAEHAPNTLLIVERSLTEAGVHERFRHIVPSEAEIDIVAVHGTLD